MEWLWCPTSRSTWWGDSRVHPGGLNDVSAPYRARGGVARGQDAGDLLVAERHLVCRFARADGRLDVGADRRLLDPFPVRAESKERPRMPRRLPLGRGPSFSEAEKRATPD